MSGAFARNGLRFWFYRLIHIAIVLANIHTSNQTPINFAAQASLVPQT